MYCPVCRADYPEDWKVCPKDTAHLLRSPQVGKYTIEGLLGVGGMGAVYRAVNPDTKGRVAIKLMNPAVAASESARTRFQREAAAVAALRTAHVVKVFDFGSDADGTLYLVMELLDGHPLREEIKPAPETMDLARVQMVMEGALKGLAAAHRAGIVHRDLKPENVFVADTDDGEVPKLLDFGIARVRTKDSDLTRTGSLMGTAAYMAVEQVAAGSGEVGPWTDVYAMGAILYEMLAGAPAYGGNTVTEVLHRVLTAEHAPLAAVRAGLPDAVYALVERCLSLEPAERPQDAEALRAELTAARLVAAGTPVPPAAKTKPQHRAPVALLSTAGSDTPAVAPSARTQATGLGSAATSTGPAMTGQPPLTGSSPATTPPPARRTTWPLAVAGVAVASVGGFVAVRQLGGGPPATTTTHDAPHVATADASVAADASAARDAAVVASIDAAIDVVQQGEAPADPRTTMIAIAAGTYTIGEVGTPHPDALANKAVTIEDVWLDRNEVTLGALRTALANPRLAGAPGDAPELPARRVTWEQARAACKAMGKRLPTEAEWEIAAATAPDDPASATLMRGKPVLVAATGKDCSPGGLCDMLGSVVEWTADDWPGKRGSKVARGASFKVAPTAGWLASVHARVAVSAKVADEEVGFRCALDAAAPADAPKPADAAMPADTATSAAAHEPAPAP